LRGAGDARAGARARAALRGGYGARTITRACANITTTPKIINTIDDTLFMRAYCRATTDTLMLRDYIP